MNNYDRTESGRTININSDFLKSYGATEEGKRVKVNDDFTILVKKPAIYQTGYIDEVFRALNYPKAMNGYKDGLMKLDENAEESARISISLKENYETNEVRDKVMNELDLKRMLESMTAEGEKYKVLCDSKKLKIGYSTMQAAWLRAISIVIITEKGIYVGNTLNFLDEQDSKRWTEELLNSIEI